MKKSAHISKCTNYRYALWRQWDDSQPYVLFVGLNPSTADAVEDDPTLRRCMGFARDWGYGGVCMANLFAYRATEPKVMMAAKDAQGPENDKWLKELSAEAGLVVAAWGNDGSFLGRSEVVREMIPKMHCLKLNKSGEPAHPLYQKATIQPKAMS